jgi:hypothetical protein
MAARLGNITFDCDDVLKLAAFWSAVLGRPLDKGSSEFFASIGGSDGERREPAWYFNKVPRPAGGPGAGNARERPGRRAQAGGRVRLRPNVAPARGPGLAR